MSTILKEVAGSRDNKAFLAALDQRFPLSRELLFFRDHDGARERLPGIVGLLAAMTSRNLDGDTCVVLPSRECVAAFTAVLVALTAARKRFPELRKAYIESGFKIGERVRVLPTKHVFEFAGVFSEAYGEFFRLRFLDKPNDSRSFPIRDAVLLERTNSRSPKGNGRTPLRSFQPSPLDRLIGIESGGNHAMLANEVMLVTTQREFLDFLDHVCVCHSDRLSESWPLRDVLSWGTVQADGSIEFGDREAAVGAPLIAVSHRTEYVAEAVKRNSQLSPRVIVDGAVRVGDLQALDDLVDHSKLLILADHTRLDDFHEIAARECRVWKLPDNLVELAGSDRGVLRNFSRAYRAASNFEFEIIRCESASCDEIVDHLIEADQRLRETEADDDSRRVLSIAYARLLEVAAMVHSPGQDGIEELRSALCHGSVLLGTKRLFMDPRANSHLEQAFKLMEQYLGRDQPDYSCGKAAKLVDLVGKLYERGEPFFVLAPSLFAASSARALLKRHVSTEIDVLTVQSFQPDSTYEDLVLTGWPRRRHLQKLLNRYAALRFHALAYGFEHDWFTNLMHRRAKALVSWEAHTGSLATLTGIQESFISEPKPLPPEPLRVKQNVDEDRLDRVRKGTIAGHVAVQEAREGRYVSFTGHAYAYITQTHRLPKLTGLINMQQNAEASGIPMVTLDQLDVGDHVLFRAPDEGQRDLIRTIAEQQMGTAEYVGLRERAEQWKIKLRALGDTTDQVWTTLKSYGCERTKVAVHTWLTDDAQIGPQHKEDIAIIAEASGDGALKHELDEVWEAIRQVRGAHTSAGAHLSGLLIKYLPRQLPSFDDEEMMVDLVLGDLPMGRVLILQIDQIDRKPEIRPYWEVNRVLWQTY